MARKYLDDTGLAALWAKIINKINALGNSLASVAFSGSYNDLINKPTVAEIDDGSTANNKAWSASKIGTDLGGKVSKSGDTATGKITFNQGIAIKAGSEISNPPFFLTLNEAFADGGNVGWKPTSSMADTIGAVKKSGDTMSGQLSFSNTSRNIQVPARSISYVDGAKGNAGIYMPHAYNADQWGPILCVQNKAGGSWSVGSYNGEDLEFVNFTKANIDSSTNAARCNYRIRPDSGWIGPWNGTTDDHGTNNTSDTWVPVYSNNKLQHRVIPTAYNNAPWSASSVVSMNGYSNSTVASTQFLAYWNGAYNNSGNSNLRYTAVGDLVTYEQSYTRNHASVSYTENLRCWRSGKVVTLGGYFSCSGNIAANTLLYTLPSPKFIIYFTAKHETQNRMYNFNLQTNGQLKTNEAIAGGNYLVCFTYVCA